MLFARLLDPHSLLQLGRHKVGSLYHHLNEHSRNTIRGPLSLAQAMYFAGPEEESGQLAEDLLRLEAKQDEHDLLSFPRVKAEP